MARAAEERGDISQSRRKILDLTLEAAVIAKGAAASVAHNVDGKHCERAEKELDQLDKEIDDRLPVCMAQATPEQVKELIACSKCITDLERIGDLLANFCARATILGNRLSQEDARDFSRIALLLENMLSDFHESFAARSVELALTVFRLDSEIDRLRNLIFIRHSENPEREARQDSLHIIFMAQDLERAGDHAKNLAEEVIHLVTGKSARHLPQKKESYEQMYMRWLRQKGERRIA